MRRTPLQGFNDPPCRTDWTKVLTTAGAYDRERCLVGLFNITAENDAAWVFPGVGPGDWDRDNEGIWIPEEKTITRYLDNVDLGYYTTAGRVRLERIELLELED